MLGAGGVALEQGVVAGVGEGAGRGLAGGSGPPARLQLGVAGRAGRVVGRRGRGQGRVEAGQRVHVAEHALRRRGAVDPAAPRLSQGQDRALVPEALLREELVRVLGVEGAREREKRTSDCVPYLSYARPPGLLKSLEKREHRSTEGGAK